VCVCVCVCVLRRIILPELQYDLWSDSWKLWTYFYFGYKAQNNKNYSGQGLLKLHTNCTDHVEVY